MQDVSRADCHYTFFGIYISGDYLFKGLNPELFPEGCRLVVLFKM
jgi:hypothetical protein